MIIPTTAQTVDTTNSVKEVDKSFLCYWGAGYNKEETLQVGVDFFNYGNGYRDFDLELIFSLEVGKTVDLTDPSGVHSVTRVA